ncbi:MAG: type II toxin-antitoxin system RelE/ParE family toxin [Proteobacteria bacterium]|nr:type II toxin-antitoxin system RelE/ParE family toxin [Pseudomonadota bacterium]
MHPTLKQKIRAALKTILDDPGTGKALRNELKGLVTFRVARFRIVYRIGKKKVIEVVAIGPRKTIYEETYRLLKKEEKEK